MKLPEFTAENMCPRDDRLLLEVVWRAAEVLRTFTVEDELDIFDANLAIPQIEALDEDDENYDELIVNEEHDLDMSIEGISTSAFQVGEGTVGFLTNIPLILDNSGKVQQVTEPGYVSLFVIEFDDLAKIRHGRTLEGAGNDTTQIVFRQPWHIDGAAIFQGFTIEEEDRIDQEQEVVEFLDDFLEEVVDVLRFDVNQDAKKGDADFMLLQLPTVIAQCAINDFLTIITNNK
jgi:hypothetical protein